MQMLRDFEPRLVGSVLTGTATEHTDIQLHLFAERAESITIRLMDLGIDHEVVERRVTIRHRSRGRVSRRALRVR